jgi:hypothetical protein
MILHAMDSFLLHLLASVTNTDGGSNGFCSTIPSYKLVIFLSEKTVQAHLDETDEDHGGQY